MKNLEAKINWVGSIAYTPVGEFRLEFGNCHIIHDYYHDLVHDGWEIKGSITFEDGAWVFVLENDEMMYFSSKGTITSKDLGAMINSIWENESKDS